MVVVVVRWSLFRGELYLERINVNVNKEHSDDIQMTSRKQVMDAKNESDF